MLTEEENHRIADLADSLGHFIAAILPDRHVAHTAHNAVADYTVSDPTGRTAWGATIDGNKLALCIRPTRTMTTADNRAARFLVLAVGAAGEALSGRGAAASSGSAGLLR